MSNGRPPFRPCHLLLSALALGVALAGQARSESTLDLPYPHPDTFGVIAASTYDERGNRVGDASIEIELLEDEHVALHMRSGFDGGARIALDSELAPITVGKTRMLRILRERSQSFAPDGQPLVILEIDHVKGKASCTQPEPDGDRSAISLPWPDRVINVPLNLLFQPLGKDGINTVNTQVFFCLGGARVMTFRGELDADREPDKATDDHIREVRYGPDGRSFLSWAAKAVAPKISFWMDTEKGGAYVAHRMPLYSKGPVVYVIADGVDPKRVIKR